MREGCGRILIYAEHGLHCSATCAFVCPGWHERAVTRVASILAEVTSVAAEQIGRLQILCVSRRAVYYAATLHQPFKAAFLL